MAKPPERSPRSPHRRLLLLGVLPALVVAVAVAEGLLVWPRWANALLGAFAVCELTALTFWFLAAQSAPALPRSWYTPVMASQIWRWVQLLLRSLACMAWFGAAVVVFELFALTAPIAETRGRLVFGMAGLLWAAALHAALMGRRIFGPTMRPAGSHP